MIPGNGPVSFSDLNIEMGRTSSAAISLGDSRCRRLASHSLGTDQTTGAISVGDMRYGQWAVQGTITVAAGTPSYGVTWYGYDRDTESYGSRTLTTTSYDLGALKGSNSFGGGHAKLTTMGSPTSAGLTLFNRESATVVVNGVSFSSLGLQLSGDYDYFNFDVEGAGATLGAYLAARIGQTISFKIY